VILNKSVVDGIEIFYVSAVKLEHTGRPRHLASVREASNCGVQFSTDIGYTGHVSNSELYFPA